MNRVALVCLGLLHAAAVGVAAQDTIDTPREVEPVTDERAVQDEVIRNQVQAVFDRVPDLAEVEVTVDAGVVRLEGTVLRDETRVQAGELAAQMEGVLFLDNRIQESTSLQEQLQPTWTRLRTLGFETVAKLPLLVLAIIIVGLATALGSWLAGWGAPKFMEVRNPFLQSLVQRVLRVALFVAALLVALDLLNATALVGALVGAAGLVGIALGFGFKDIVENYLAGAILAVRQPFKKNDQIQVEGFEGKVVRLTARETIMMTLDGNHVRLPNAILLRNPMVNFSRNPLRRFHFDAGVGSTDDLALAREVALTALSGVEGVPDDPPPQALVTELGDSTVTMRFTAWVDQRQFDFLRVRSEAIRAVKARLEAEGLNLPAPEFMIRLSGGSVTAPDGISIRPASPAPPSGPAPVSVSDPPPVKEVKAADVSVDEAVDKQIEEDRRVSVEPDLLDSAGAPRT